MSNNQLLDFSASCQLNLGLTPALLIPELFSGMSLNSSIRGSIAVFRSYKPILRPRLSIFVGNKRKYERKLCTRGDSLSSRSFSSSTAKINDETLPHSDGLTRYPLSLAHKVCCVLLIGWAL